MINSNDLYIFLLEHDQNGVWNHNIYSFQESINSDDPSSIKSKHICAYLPNIVILKKSATPGKFQITFAHMAVGNNPYVWIVTAFALLGFH